MRRVIENVATYSGHSYEMLLFVYDCRLKRDRDSIAVDATYKRLPLKPYGTAR